MYAYKEVVVLHHIEQVILSPYQKGLSILAMKFSNAALAALPFVAFTQLVSLTKAVSTTGLTIADGMVVELCEGSNITVDNDKYYSPALTVGDYSSNGDASLTITGGSYKTIKKGDGMVVKGGSVATVLGGTLQGGKYGGGGMSVDSEAVATVCDGMIQGGTSPDKGWYGVYANIKATVRIAGGMMIGGYEAGGIPPGGFGFQNHGDATITGGTFKGGFNSTSGYQAPSLGLRCGNTSIYGGTYEGNWSNILVKSCDEFYITVYGKDLVFKDNHLVGTLCDGNTINVYISGDGFGYGSNPETGTVYTENNCTSFPKFDECGGKGGKSGKKTKSTLFRP
jgi:hypothetical protein